jgi:Tol biopolymer transport system component
MHISRRSWFAALGVTAILGAVVAGTAHATFGGKNGSLTVGVNVRKDDWDVYRVDPDGSAVDLTPRTSRSHDDQAAWSPDGKKLAFSSDRSGSFAIYLMNPDGSGVTPVPNTTGGRQPSWSPDGTKLLFQAPPGSFQLFVVNVDGTGLMQLTNTAAPAQNFNPHFSPAGNKIVFSSNRTQNYSCGGGSAACLSVYTMKPDGSNVVKLTDDSLDAAWPDWSPSGNDIVFTNHWYDPNSNIFVIHADGTELRQVTHTTGDNFQGRWSPDGTKIVYTNLDSFPFELYTINSDGTGSPTKLTSIGGAAFGPDWGSTP